MASYSFSARLSGTGAVSLSGGVTIADDFVFVTGGLAPPPAPVALPPLDLGDVGAVEVGLGALDPLPLIEWDDGWLLT